MRSGPARRRGRWRRRVVDLLRGVLCLLVLVLLLGGIPAALIWMRGNPLPDVALNIGAVLEALTRPDDGSMFLAALTWICWIAWASFAASVLVEIPAQLRGIPGPHLPGLGLQQHAASSLLAGVALLTAGLAPAMTTPASSDARPVTAVSTILPTAPAPTALTQPAPAPVPVSADADAPTHTVLPGDSLWRIAQDRLGDGARYTEIAAANYERPQPDGQALTGDHWLRAGWTLVLPADASVAPADTVTGQHVVRAGETLHGIAHEVLGPAADARELYTANRGRVQADGGRLTDPDLIRPGWILDVPAAEQEEPAPGRLSTVEVPAVELPAAAAPTVDAPAAEVPTAEPAADPATGGLLLPAVRTGFGVGGLLACSLMVLLDVRRRRQRRRRRLGQRIPMPPPALEATERGLRAVQDPDSRVRVDRVLRTLSVLLGQAGQSLPGLCLVRVQEQHMELYLADECVLPAPFTATAERSVWTLDPQAPLLSAAEIQDVAAPYPALVTIGHDAAGGHVLLELEQLGALSVAGEQPAGLAVLAALAAELATSDWADHVQVTLVGCFPELPDALGTGRVRYAPTLRAVLPELERHVADVRTVLRADGLRDLRQARTATPGEHLHGDCWMPDIVLIAGPVEPALQDRLRAVLHTEPHGGVAAVMIGAATEVWQLRLGDAGGGPEGTAVLSPYAVELLPQQLTGPDLTELLALLAIASRPPTMPDGQVCAVSPELTLTDLGRELAVSQDAGDTASGQLPADGGVGADDECAIDDDIDEGAGVGPAADGPPAVLVLGPVVVQGATGTLEEGKRRQLTEIAAFLALYPGADHHGFSEAIWPGARAVEQTRNTAFSKLRTWLGPQFVPRVSGGGYRLEEVVRTDWHRWQDLMVAGPAATSTVDLARALELVRGQPFESHPPGRYAWSERGKQEMISAVGDAAHELAVRALLAGDATLARRAALAGRQAEPGNEMLWRDALEAEWLAGDRAGLDRIASQLTALADDLGDELEPETLALLEELASGRPRAASRVRRGASPETVI